MLKGFKKKLIEHSETIQEMVDQDAILDPDFIKVCMENGIKFKPEFLEKINFKPPKSD